MIPQSVKDAIGGAIRNQLVPIGSVVERPPLDKKAAQFTVFPIFVALVVLLTGVGLFSFFQARPILWERLPCNKQPAQGQECEDKTAYPIYLQGYVNPYLTVSIILKHPFSVTSVIDGMSRLSKAIFGMTCKIGDPHFPPVQNFTWEYSATKILGTPMYDVCDNPSEPGVSLMTSTHLQEDVVAFIERMNMAIKTSNWYIYSVGLARVVLPSQVRRVEVTFDIVIIGSQSETMYQVAVQYRTLDCSKSDLTLFRVGGDYLNCLGGQQEVLDCAKTKDRNLTSMLDYFAEKMPNVSIPPALGGPFWGSGKMLERVCTHVDLMSTFSDYETFAAIRLSSLPRPTQKIVDDLAESLVKHCPFKIECKTPQSPTLGVWFAVFSGFITLPLKYLPLVAQYLYRKLSSTQA